MSGSSDFQDVGNRDLRALVTLIADARDDEPGPGQPWALLEGILRLIPCVQVCFNESLIWQRRFVVTQGMATPDDFDWGVPDLAPDAVWWTESLEFDKLQPSPTVPEAHRWSADPQVLRQIKASRMYQEEWSPATDALSVRLPALPGTRRGMVLFREGDSFTVREQALLTLLRPHLAEIHLTASRRRRGIPDLTEREWEVIRLAAGGLSNQQIAHVLFTSLSTVRKHLEHIYDKSGARSRSAAVALLMPPVGV
jgi:DNA-binding CsgD family transcriptional regulator